MVPPVAFSSVHLKWTTGRPCIDFTRGREDQVELRVNGRHPETELTLELQPEQTKSESKRVVVRGSELAVLCAEAYNPFVSGKKQDESLGPNASKAIRKAILADPLVLQRAILTDFRKIPHRDVPKRRELAAKLTELMTKAHQATLHDGTAQTPIEGVMPYEVVSNPFKVHAGVPNVSILTFTHKYKYERKKQPQIL